METIKQLDLADVPETSRTTEEENVWRDDEVKLSFSQAEALQNAAKKYKGFYLVPLVLIGKDAP
jgi:aspartyl/glutamyl-tRNA(Asn/Gln) amidotransferase C subunit